MSYGVEITGLSKSFGDLSVVSDFNLKVEAGSFVSLLGSSGCGKTTTLRMIAGLETPTAGEISLQDELVFSGKRRVDTSPNKRQIGFVFQNYALWPHMTVFENLAYPLKRSGTPAAEIETKVQSTLKLLAVPHLAQRYPAEISGGQQQRIALGRAIINPRNKVILFDEPLSNLDAGLREELRVEIRHLQEELRFTAIYVTHDHAEALSMSDRVVLMRSGCIEREGDPGSVFSDPQTRYVAEFFGVYNILPATVRIDEGRGYLETGMGRIPAAATGRPLPAPGAKVEAALPTDGIEVGTEEGGDRVRLTVSGVSYYGNLSDLQLKGDGYDLRCRVMGGRKFKRGQAVFARVLAPAVILER